MSKTQIQAQTAQPGTPPAGTSMPASPPRSWLTWRPSIRTWVRPWNAGHAARPMSWPLRANGTTHRGVNVLLLWAEA